MSALYPNKRRIRSCALLSCLERTTKILWMASGTQPKIDSFISKWHDVWFMMCCFSGSELACSCLICRGAYRRVNQPSSAMARTSGHRPRSRRQKGCHLRSLELSPFLSQYSPMGYSRRRYSSGISRGLTEIQRYSVDLLSMPTSTGKLLMLRVQIIVKFIAIMLHMY